MKLYASGLTARCIWKVLGNEMVDSCFCIVALFRHVVTSGIAHYHRWSTQNWKNCCEVQWLTGFFYLCDYFLYSFKVVDNIAVQFDVDYLVTFSLIYEKFLLRKDFSLYLVCFPLAAQLICLDFLIWFWEAFVISKPYPNTCLLHLSLVSRRFWSGNLGWCACVFPFL